MNRPGYRMRDYKLFNVDMNRPGYRMRDDKLFNVDMDGKRAATGISREAAEVYLNEWRARPTGAKNGPCLVFLMERPLTDPTRPKYRRTLPARLPSLRVSAAERTKLLDKLRADGTLATEETTV